VEPAGDLVGRLTGCGEAPHPPLDRPQPVCCHDVMLRPYRDPEVAVKTLHLLRHAKSDWGDPSIGDHERPLNDRGRRALLLLADHVAGWKVDLVVSSTAVRALTTATAVAEAIGTTPRTDQAIYRADAHDMLEVIRALPDSAGSAMLVGHNPTMTELTELLCGSSPPYPTGALGTVELGIDRWCDARPGCGTCVAHVTPKQIGARD
jgi:phosphohistidine phosphatase